MFVYLARYPRILSKVPSAGRVLKQCLFVSECPGQVWKLVLCGTLVSVAWSCSGWSPRMQCLSSLSLSLVARPALAPSFLDLSAIGTVSTGQRCLRLDGGVTSTACRVSESKRRASPRQVSSMEWRACPLKSVCLLHIRSFTCFVTFPLASINSRAGHSRPRRQDNFTLHLGDTVSLHPPPPPATNWMHLIWAPDHRPSDSDHSCLSSTSLIDSLSYSSVCT